MLEVQVWVCVDENGDYAVHKDGPHEAGEAYQDDIGGHGPRRTIQVTLMVPVPKQIEMAGTVPDEATGVELVAR
jgi:hypothetical protein